MRVTILCRCLVLGIAAALLASPALAADKPTKEARRLQMQLRQAEQEKASLSQQVVESENKLKDAQGKTADAEKRAAAEAGRVARLNRSIEALTAEKDAQAAAAAEDHAQLAARLADTERKLAQLQADHSRLDAACAQQKTELAGCRVRNDKMYRLGNELLDRYEQKGCAAALLQAEPFTGLKRAQIEKMVEQDRDTLDANQLVQPGSAGAAAP